MVRMVVVLFVCLHASLSHAAGLPETPQFRRFGFEHGLPKSANHVGVDRQGYVWIATSDGLARYDGVDFRMWRRQAGVRGSLPENRIDGVFIDPRDNVWVASPLALSVLGPDRRRFRTMRFPGRASACGRKVTTMTASARDGLWIATADGTVCHLDRNERAELHAAPATTGLSIMTSVLDSRGRLLLGTNHGLMHFERGSFREIAPGILGKSWVTMLTTEADGTLWIGSGQGLHRLVSGDRIEAAPWKLPADATHGLVLRDRRGGRWIGTMQGLYREKNGEFSLVEHRAAAAPLGRDSGILYLQEDLEGGLWLVTFSQGLMYLPPDWDRFATVTEVGGALLEGLDLRDAVTDRAGGFWVATATDLYRLEQGARRLRRVAGREALGVQWIHSLLARKDGRLWVGHATGLVLFDPVTRRSLPWLDGLRTESPVEVVVEATDGSLWLEVSGEGTVGFTATGQPLHDGGAGDRAWGQSNALQADPGGTPWCSDNKNLLRWNGRRFDTVPLAPGEDVDSFTFATAKRLWVSRFGALEGYDWNGHALELKERIDGDDGLPAVAASGMLVSPGGNLWLSTLRGLVRYSPAKRQVRVFGAQDGLPDPDFSPAVPSLGANGTALAVSTGGLVLFDSDMPQPIPSRPRLVIEALSALHGEDDLQFDPRRPVWLDQQDRDLRVTARLLSFADPRAHRYRFRLEGHDANWAVQDANGERVYSRLQAGRFRLHVQAAGADGAWSDRWTTTVVVRPPWWRTGPSMFGIALLSAVMLWWLARIYRRRLKRRHAWQLAVHTRNVAEQASDAKTRFLATLGHEVRTPMTGVLGMSELLLGTELDQRQHGYVDSIRRAGDHLLRLVNDALDLARIEADKLELVIEPFDLHALIDEVALLMAPMAERKGLEFTGAIEAGVPPRLMGDCGRIRQILLNLVGNAIKFTERGEVGVRVRRGPLHSICFEITDTGPGLNEEQRARLFQRFEQADGARTAARYGGSGLGLAISQELAAAMEGRIHVASEPGKGTRFRVQLPLAEAPGIASTPPQRGETPERVLEGLDVLLVEDDQTVADVIAGLLSARGHRVTHAAHGLAALSEADRARFDVALLDLDLPGMDGFALARQLDCLGFSAPLIAVTARSDADAEPQARAAGFHGFLRKPLTGRMLSATIEFALHPGVPGASS